MSTNDPSTKKAEFIGLAIGAGLMFAAVPTCFQVLWRERACAPGDVLIGVGLTAIVSVPLMLVLLGLPALLLARGTWLRARGGCVPAVVGAGMVFSLAAVVILLAWRNRDGAAIAVGLVGAPLTALVCALIGRSVSACTPWRASAAMVGVGALIVAVACGATASGISESAAILSFVVMACAAATLLVRTARVGLRRVSMTVMSVALVVGVLSIARSSGPAASFAGSFSANDSHPPNVVLIVLDTTRRDHIGAYGKEPSPTPRLDALARQGVVYDRAFSAAPWTIPSHASLFTGLFPISHGCSNEHHLWLDDEFTTLAETLADRGYQTVSMNSNPYIDHCNLLQGFADTISLTGPYDKLAAHAIAQTAGVPERWVDKGCAEAVDALEGWFTGRRDPSKPFFMFLNLFEAHREYVLPRSGRDVLDGGPMDGLRGAMFGMRFDPIPYEIGGIEDEMRSGFVKALYEAEIRYQDRRLGEWLDVLARRADFENTLIIVTADHGENLGDHGRWEHIHQINDDLIHVPLIVRYPRGEAGGTRLSGLCQLGDIMPTVLETVGASPAPHVPGHSLHPKRFSPREAAFAEVAPYYLHFQKIRTQLGFEASIGRFNRLRRVVRTKEMKYIWASDGTHELFDIRRDPGETRNLIESDAATAVELHGRLMEWVSSQPKYVPPVRDDDSVRSAPVDAETIERLRGLGYVGG